MFLFLLFWDRGTLLANPPSSPQKKELLAGIICGSGCALARVQGLIGKDVIDVISVLVNVWSPVVLLSTVENDLFLNSQNRKVCTSCVSFDLTKRV